MTWLLALIPGPKKITNGFPMSPARARMVDAMADAVGLYQLGGDWYIRGGIKVADATGTRLSHRLNPSKSDHPGGAHKGDDGASWGPPRGGEHKG